MFRLHLVYIACRVQCCACMAVLKLEIEKESQATVLVTSSTVLPQSDDSCYYSTRNFYMYLLLVARYTPN